MKRLAKVLREPMAGADGVDVADAGGDAELLVKGRVSWLEASRKSLASRSRLLRRAKRCESRSSGLVSRAKVEASVEVESGGEESVEVESVVGASGAAGTRAAGISGWTRCGSGLHRGVRGRLRWVMRLLI
jgi:hypothetical protein